jgi:hypothetical protein
LRAAGRSPQDSLYGRKPWLYLHGLFTRLPDHPINRIEQFLPDRWKPATQAVGQAAAELTLEPAAEELVAERTTKLAMSAAMGAGDGNGGATRDVRDNRTRRGTDPR